MDCTCASGVDVKNLRAGIAIPPCLCSVIRNDKDY